MEVSERQAEIEGVPVRWLEAGDSRALYLHGVPNSADMWRPFLEHGGGIAPDLPGFGRSGKAGDFDHSIEGYGRFLEAFADHVGLDELRIAMHDWGGVGLELAQRFPERVRRLVLVAVVPLLPGYRWHRTARIWRRRPAGELLMGTTTRWAVRRALPEQVVDEFWPYFDHGTQRAILELYRSAPEAALARAGERLGEIACPALVAWGNRDPYLPEEFARRYADALGGEAEVEILDGGHWLWLDRPELVERISDFVGRP